MDIKKIEELLTKKNLKCVYSNNRHKSYENSKYYIVVDKLRNDLVIHTLDKNGMMNPMNSGHLNFNEAYYELLMLI